ncbi:MAG TPA: hypothetical protein VL691_22370 [Vicinamibacteria bacterium]|nr:hypothetical protein [Vicinamibacteria bacterium]
MKLNPPASSSDLEAAREVARRLHMRRRRDDHAGFEPPAPAPRPVAPPAPGRRPAPPPPPALEATPEMPPPPSWDEPVGEAEPPDASFDPLAGIAGPNGLAGTLRPDEDDLPDVEVESSAPSPQEMVGAVEPGPGLEDLAEPYAAPPPSSPFEVDLDGPSAPDVVGASALPSWDDVVAKCLVLSQSRAVMLVDPAGQVFAAHGDWPAPGPDAIAAKLVSTMDRTLKDAPTRSIQAPLAGRHLTAWRVPLVEGLVTVAFLGDAPVRTETRPAVDSEIHRGAGA